MRPDRHTRRYLSLLLPLALYACDAGTPKKQEAPPAPAPAVSQPEPLPEPELTPKEHNKLAIDYFQQGEFQAAREQLKLSLDKQPGNFTARKLLKQFDVDPQAHLGSASFDYVVQSGDSLSLLAERFLGDGLAFVVLARYNQIDKPALLHAGQVLRIPQTNPPAENTDAGPESDTVTQEQANEPGAAQQEDLTAPAVTTAEEPEPQAAPKTVEEPGLAAYRDGLRFQASGEPDKALRSFDLALAADPDNPAYLKAGAEARKQLVDLHHRKALEFYRREQLEPAKTHWQKVLQIDPDNRIAPGYLSKVEEIQRRLRELEAR